MGSKVIRNITKVFKSASGVLFGRATAGTGRGEELTPAQVRSLLSVYTISQTDTAISTAVNALVAGAPGLLDTLDELSAALGDDANFASTVTTALAGKAAASHNHGNITNAGAIGSTASLPVITGASGVLEAGSFGTTAGTFCQGNDARLSDARTPTAHTHTAAAITDFSEAVDDEVATLLVAGTNITITYNDAANTLTIASTASGLSGTGSVDNAVLRADGTGGATLQSSAIVIDDLFTASPNNTVNFVCLKPTGGTSNVGVAVVPQGTAPFTLAVPDGTTTGGNARGTNAIDLQTVRTAASQVASGSPSILMGRRGTASGAESICLSASDSTASAAKTVAIGDFANATTFGATAIGINAAGSGNQSFAINNSTASGLRSISLGNATASATDSLALQGGTASGQNSVASGIGSLANRFGLRASANGIFAASGDAQRAGWVLRNKTTNNTPTTLFADGSSTRLTITSGKILFADVMILGSKSDGLAVACYRRRVAIKNVSGTTTLVGSVETIGTDIEDNAATDVAITADDTNDALQINVTGITGETWRWVARVEGLEIAYGV